MTRSFVSAVVLSAFMIVSCFSASAQSIILGYGLGSVYFCLFYTSYASGHEGRWGILGGRGVVIKRGEGDERGFVGAG